MTKSNKANFQKTKNVSIWNPSVAVNYIRTNKDTKYNRFPLDIHLVWIPGKARGSWIANRGTDRSLYNNSCTRVRILEDNRNFVLHNVGNFICCLLCIPLLTNEFPVHMCMERMLVAVMVMEHICQDPNKAEHWANEDLVISFHPVKLDLASTIEWEGHQGCHYCDGTASIKRKLGSNTKI
jgi:hypothetical protein